MYRYETHLHTVESSACGVTPGSEYPAIFKSRGYDGIFITDHFFHGNTRPSRELPWPEYVDAYTRGYEEAKKAGDAIGFKVFFGIEENFDGDEYLIYGVDKEFLLAHPDIPHWTREQMISWVHAAGGAVIQAHPFRMRDYMTYIRLGLSFADGAEVANAGNRSVHDTYAYHYAQEFGLVMTAGSDNHDSSKIQSQDDLFGVSLDAPLTSIQDYVQLIRSRGPIHLHVPDDRFSADPNTSEQLHSFWIDSYEHLIPTRRLWINPFSPTDPE